MQYHDKELMELAKEYAHAGSTCLKVKVGCVIVVETIDSYAEQTYNDPDSLIKFPHIVAHGTNRCVPLDCPTKGCLREEKYGNNNKEHRNPDDCRAIHSEIDAITQLTRRQLQACAEPLLKLSTHKTKMIHAYITRYPCEACARVLVRSGVKRVVYGRQQEISDMTKEIFQRGSVDVVWMNDWSDEDVTN